LFVVDLHQCDASVDIEIQSACIDLVKSLDPVDQSFNAIDDVITYALALSNTGQLDIYNVSVNDPTADDVPLYLNGDLNNNDILETDEVWYYTVNKTISQGDLNNGIYENIATAEGEVDLDNNDQPESSISDQDDEIVYGEQLAKVRLLKEAVLPLTDTNNDGLPGYIGDVIAYTFTIENSGNVTLSNIAVTDPKATVIGQLINELLPGQIDDSSFTAEYTITQLDFELGVVINSALVAAFDPSGALVEDISDDPADLEDEDLNDDGDPDDPTEVPITIESNIGDRVWMDENGDGIQNDNEPGVEGVLVELYNADSHLIASTVTDAQGHFMFTVVAHGEHFLKFSHSNTEYDFTFFRATYDPGLDNDVNNANGLGTTPDFMITPGSDNMDIDAGYYQCVEIKGMTWCDFNKNNMLDEKENGINGLNISLYRLYKGEWVLWDSEVSKNYPDSPYECGYWSFCAMPGIYYVSIPLPPNGLKNVLPNIGSVNSQSSHIFINGAVGASSSFHVNSNNSGIFIGAGFYNIP
jgi:uncharacterized repeat protein (TIGR01451 family)